MRIYFVRHGESTYNAQNLHQHGEVPLSEKGIEQAQFVAKRFKSIDFDVIISSDYARAKSTAEAIHEETGKTLEFSELARERRLPSELHGKHMNDPSLQNLKDTVEANIHNPDFRYSDEENFFDLKIRAKKLLGFLESRPEENVVVVLHGTILRYVMCVMAFGTEFDWSTYIGLGRFLHLDNTGITICEQEDGRWRLITWNDRMHLGEFDEAPRS